MASRSVHTVIYLGSSRTDRVDFGRAPSYSVIAQHHQLSHGSDDPVSRVQAALASTPKAGKLVWILWEGASTQMLDMPAGVVDGLEREQLADALGYEAEPLSGIPASESEIDGVPQRNPPGSLPDYRRYWVTQVPSGVANRLEQVVSSAGSRLAGISHPGGLPREQWTAGAASVTQWRRIEIWDQLTFGLQSRPDGSIDTRIIRAVPHSDAWNSDLPTTGTLSLMGAEPRHATDLSHSDVEQTSAARISFPADGAPVEWMHAWAAELTAQPRRVPAARSHGRVSPNRKFFVAGGLAAAVVLTAIASHATWLSMQTAQIKAQADHLALMRQQMTPPDNSAAEVQRLNIETAPLKEELKNLEAERAGLEVEKDKGEEFQAKINAVQATIREAQAVHGPAIAGLLTVLTESEQRDHAGDIVVKEVRKQDSGELVLTGLCRKAVLADSFATRLEARLDRAGWRVGAAQKRLRDDGLAFDYSIILTPSVLLGAVPLPVATDTTRPSLAAPVSEPARPASILHHDPASTAAGVLGVGNR